MEDFSSELFSSFFEDHLLERPLLADRTSLLHMDIDSNPGQSLLLFVAKLRLEDVCFETLRLPQNLSVFTSATLIHSRWPSPSPGQPLRVSQLLHLSANIWVRNESSPIPFGLKAA